MLILKSTPTTPIGASPPSRGRTKNLNLVLPLDGGGGSNALGGGASFNQKEFVR